jgi:hypothetical protein
MSAKSQKSLTKCPNITFLDIIHRLVSYLKRRPVYFSKHNVLGTGNYLRRQVRPTQLGPIDRTSPYHRTPVSLPIWIKTRRWIMSKSGNICTNVPSSQTFRSNQKGCPLLGHGIMKSDATMELKTPRQRNNSYSRNSDSPWWVCGRRRISHFYMSLCSNTESSCEIDASLRGREPGSRGTSSVEAVTKQRSENRD